MNFLDSLQAILLLGAPMALLSWFVFSWLFGAGEIDRTADRGAINSRLKKMKKVVAERRHKNAGYVYEQWTWFGTGFYGLAALWTFLVIEIGQLLGFLFNFPGFAALFADGIIAFLIGFTLDQLGNVIQAFVWFFYWPADSILVWILVAYLGYWTGVELARREVEFPFSRWLRRLGVYIPLIKRRAGALVARPRKNKSGSKSA